MCVEGLYPVTPLAYRLGLVVYNQFIGILKKI